MTRIPELERPSGAAASPRESDPDPVPEPKPGPGAQTQSRSPSSPGAQTRSRSPASPETQTRSRSPDPVPEPSRSGDIGQVVVVLKSKVMLKLKTKFDLNRDVVCDVIRRNASVGVKESTRALDTRILNMERDGGILYSWEGATGTTRIGKYDPSTKQNKLLYTFDKQVCVSSCSLNQEETLLAVSLAQRNRGDERLKPMSKCLTLLIEIHPINNTKVLKAVDFRVRVQFLHPETRRSSVMESHLLLLTEDGYVDQYHVLLTKQEGYRVVMVNPERLSKAAERIVEDFSWIQWDTHTQRLYYLTHRDKSLLRCVQFYPNHNCETVLELPLELPANPFTTVKFVNLGFDHYHEDKPEQEPVRLEVFTNRIGNLIYRTSHIQADWDKLRSEKRRSASHLKHMEENTKKVLSMVDTWSLDKKLVPLFQEEDNQQRALIGLTVEKLRDHLNRHLPRLGKKKIDSLVVDYVAKLLELIRHMLESVWLKYQLGPRVLSFAQRGSRADAAVLHFMFRILEATRALCLPLPPGYHTLLAVLGVRCLSHHTFLQYVDHGILQLTETFVSRLMTDLDNSDDNEKLKFSILKRLPESMEQRIFQLWDHPVSSASISRDYVKILMEKHNKNKGFTFTGPDKPGFTPEFLPLTHLAKTLSDIEDQVLNPFEDQENVDARFVEETALRQTLVLLGFEVK
ncbi:gamma-secretase-activating protein-like [Diretmus argenteus]